MADTQSARLSDPEFSAKSSLTAFGRLCSKYAEKFGLDEMAFASQKQKHWARAAPKAIAAMRDAGAPVDELRLRLFETRPILRTVEALAQWAAGEPRANFDFGQLDARVDLSRKVGSLPPAQGGAFEYDAENATGSIRIRDSGLSTHRAVRDLARLMGAEGARMAVAGHEAGHFAQTVDRFDLARKALRAVVENAGDSSPATRDFARRCEAACEIVRLSLAPSRGAVGEILDWLDESIADAFGAWCAELCGVSGAARKIADWRHKSARRATPGYATEWLLDSLSMETSLPRDYSEFKAVLSAHMAVILPIALELYATRKFSLSKIQASRRPEEQCASFVLRESHREHLAARVFEAAVAHDLPALAEKKWAEMGPRPEETAKREQVGHAIGMASGFWTNLPFDVAVFARLLRAEKTLLWAEAVKTERLPRSAGSLRERLSARRTTESGESSPGLGDAQPPEQPRAETPR